MGMMMSWKMVEKEAPKIGSFTKTAIKLAWTVWSNYFEILKSSHRLAASSAMLNEEAGKLLGILVFYIVTTIFYPPALWQSAVGMVAPGTWCILPVLQKLWGFVCLFVLTAAFDCWGASTETDHCFKIHRLMWFLWHLPKEFKETKYF